MKIQEIDKKEAVYNTDSQSFTNTTPPLDLLTLIPRNIIQELGCFVFEKNADTIKVAALEPKNPVMRNFMLKHFASQKIEFYKTDNEKLEQILKIFPRNFKEEIEELSQPSTGVNGNVIKIVDSIIAYAIAEKASDIHIDPLRNETAVRFRVDGILHRVSTINRDLHQAVIARLKILSNMKIDEYRRPQDGRIEPENMPDTSIRISTAPTLYGEKAALRIMDDSHKNLSLQSLGFSPVHEELLRRNAEKPFGMIVTSGPTGSGKTTTLYGLLNLLKKDDVNISTLEDPIEFAVNGVNQIQVNPRFDLTYASGLRALLRQDPDVIMVGEIRDSETVIMAANAALTGHLVLTTIHTNDAPSVFTRFLEMKVEDFVVSSIVNLVVAQRLLRKICGKCAKSRPLTELLIKKMKTRKDFMEALERNGKNISDMAKIQFRIGSGCETCLGTGYSGRIGMFELLELNPEIHDLILQHAPAEKIKAAAEKEGFKTMIHDGIEKVFAGVTTFEEILRTTRTA